MLIKIGLFICSMVYSTYIKRRIIKLHTSDHLKPSAIRDKLRIKKDIAKKDREWKVVNDDKGSEIPC